MRKILVIIIMNLLKLFWILPLKKNRVTFISFNGQQYSDSPKYIYEFLLNNKDLEFCWILNKNRQFNIPGKYKVVNNGTFKEIIVLLTSKVIVTNNFIQTYIPIRNNQVVLNTWHGGGAYKKVGLMSPNVTDYDRWFFNIHRKKYTAFTSDSNICENVLLRNSFAFNGEILRYGLPRNSILFKNNSELQSFLRSKFNSENKLIILYAPTFRGSASACTFLDDSLSLRIDDIRKVIYEKYNKECLFLFRGHHTFNDISMNSYTDVTNYPDMQELLIVSDILITDYSSCMWDMALMKKPVYLYTPDIDLYISNQGFYIEPNLWPFDISKTNADLINHISSFDSIEYNNKLDKYFHMMKPYEDIMAVDKTANWILRKMKE